MKILRLLMLLGLVTAGITACDENPIAEDGETSTRLAKSASFLNLTVNAEKKVGAYTVNKYGQATFENVTATACDAKVAIREDTTRLPIEPPAKMIARGVTAGTSCIVFSGGRFTDTVTVRVQ